jgi:phosphoglycolate phosphatase (TIGR01487 family)
MNLDSSLSPSALVCDVDGTITDQRRRLSTSAVIAIRRLVDAGVLVVVASGNTICSLNMLCKMIGTDGSIIAENGGVYRVKFQGEEHVCGKRTVCWSAFNAIKDHFLKKGIEIELYSPHDRLADVAFARSVDVDEVREVVKAHPVQVLDTGFAIHIQSQGVTKGTALDRIASDMGLSASDFLAIGDSKNDIEMIRNAGVGVAVANAHPELMNEADLVTEKKYGDGFVEALNTYFPYFFER